MTYIASFELHHNFPKLAEESGFTFNTHKPRVHVEWNKIKLIDIDSIIKDRKFVLLEQHIKDILGCVLESEFDVRILDEGVLKIFRLSQLTVEYQQFCRNYLDRSIYVLREEVTNLLKDVETTRRNLREKDEEIRKLKRKNKHSMRTSHPYGNDNIATMLLKTLNNTKGDIFNSTSHTDVLQQYNKCNYCEKVFLNQLYLKSHISRRHPEFLEIPQKDAADKITPNENTNSKLNAEIEELKTKLQQMEDRITNTRGQDEVNNNPSDTHKIQSIGTNCELHKEIKEMKDAEVLTDEDRKIDQRIENWKKEEYEKYNQEIILLRNQITEIISNKVKQEQSSVQNDFKIMEELQATIKQQSAEIIALKKELLNSENNEKDRRKEIESQMTYWIKQAEKQSNEYKILLQKLDEVTNEARECRARAETEREKSSKLQEILDQHLNRTSPKQSKSINFNKNLEKTDGINNTNHGKTVNATPKAATVDFLTLTKLQQKAHELLNMNDISTCESSSVSDEKIEPKKITVGELIDDEPPKQSPQKLNTEDTQLKAKHEVRKLKKNRNKSDKKPKNKSNSGKQATSKIENGYAHIPNSPMKVVRAKITEQVNQRLISLGVDPLRNRLPQNTFQKQRVLLQKEQDIKIKKFPVREKILHSIMARLDETTSNKNVFQRNDYISPNKSPKTFSLSSVLTNVKTKALSLVKSNESINNTSKSYNDIAKRAMAILKTPPDSANSSPKVQRQNDFISPEKNTKISKSRKNMKNQPSKSLLQNKKSDTLLENDTSDDTTSKSLEQKPTKNKISKAVKSPLHNPTDLSINQNLTEHSLFAKRDNKFNSKIDDLYETKAEIIDVGKKSFFENKENSSDDVESIVDSSPRKFFSEENISNLKQTKGVLKNASSTSSLNKKKVLFDMDAIQMKSVSASPSQSITEKSDDNEKNKYGVVNLETDEWDISSIENDQPTSTVKVQITSHTSPKIAELKESIECQLTRRNPSLSTALVGGVDVLTAPIQKATSFCGSNTSLGSSILDDTDSVPLQNKTLIKPRHIEKDDSEIEISDLINDAVIDSKNYVKSY